MKKITKKFDVVVVGGGMSGVCAAIASARNGANTALVQNRSVLGGNASSEVRMHICGADSHGSRPNARETGILEEILLDNKKKNPQNSYSEFDRVIWEKVHFQEGLELFLNTHVSEVCLDSSDDKYKRIRSVTGVQNTTEIIFTFEGEIFLDTTGDALLADLAGGEYMVGREGQDVFGETYAPKESDSIVMGSTLLFKTIDMAKPIAFEKPSWANTYTEEDLCFRDHGAQGYNYWWIELGGDDLEIIHDGEIIRDELLKSVYGVWDHIKNYADHGAENYALDWVGFLPGKRESRRVVGDHILKEQDLLNAVPFEDTVAYGGWPMDVHVVGGLKTKLEPTDMIHLPDVYSIPYRSLYSKGHSNLLVGGRAISASHMAFSSTRIMATCSVVGQTIGTAAALCIEKGCNVPGIQEHIEDLQNLLLKDDAYLPNIKDIDKNNLARVAQVKASSEAIGASANEVVSGIARQVKDTFNGWRSNKLKDEWIELAWPEIQSIKEVRLTFDSNLSRQIMLTMFDNGKEGQYEGLPYELIKDYKLVFYIDENQVYERKIENNHLRLNSIPLDEAVSANRVRLIPLDTYGIDHARVFEIKVYS